MIQAFSALDDILKREKVSGCFVDTSVLFSATYPLDQFNEECESIFENLAEHEIPIFTNVNVRAEFLENHRRVLIGEALIDFLDEAEGDLSGPLAEKLKSHRTSFRRKVEGEKSAKMDVNQIKMFRNLFAAYKTFGNSGWKEFCRLYLQARITPLWDDVQREMNLNPISVRSENQNPYLNQTPKWQRATELVG
jgi:hypothetical protein